MLMLEEIESIEQLYQGILAGINADLETGSHGFNNMQSKEFTKEFQNLTAALHNFGVWIDEQRKIWETPDTPDELDRLEANETVF